MRIHALSKLLMAGFICGLVAAACSAPDPGAYTLSDKTPRIGTSSGATTSGSSGTNGTTSGSSGTGSSGTSGSDAGKDSGSSGTSGTVLPAFKNAPAYVATLGQSANNANHGGGGNPPSHDCFTCHVAGGGGAGQEMQVAGYIGNGAGAPVAKAEVRVADAQGNAILQGGPIYTDANGYFHLLGTALAGGPYYVGVRTATSVGMVGTISAGGCGAQACHGGTQGDIHVP